MRAESDLWVKSLEQQKKFHGQCPQRRSDDVHCQPTQSLCKFNWNFTDPHGTKIGSISWPDCAEATNARVSFKGMYPGSWQKNVEIVISGHTY